MNRWPQKITSLFNKPMSRREFLKISLGLLAFSKVAGHAPWTGAQTSATNARPKRKIDTEADLVSVEGNDPYAITTKAVQALGGMERFVAKNSTVVIKPNIGWDRAPEQAGNTNPLVVAALVDLCFRAGAKRVNVFDVTCNAAKKCYDASGIQKAASERGARVYIPPDWDTVPAKFAHTSPMQDWPILRDALECDTFINVPVLKHHALTRLTLSMKNLMGVCTGSRGLMHQNIGPKLVDLTKLINPDLTVIDAYRVLVRNGPTGGNLQDVETKKTVLASADATLADLYACRLMDVSPDKVPYVWSAVQDQFGITSIDAANILRLTL